MLQQLSKVGLPPLRCDSNFVATRCSSARELVSDVWDCAAAGVAPIILFISSLSLQVTPGIFLFHFIAFDVWMRSRLDLSVDSAEGRFRVKRVELEDV